MDNMHQINNLSRWAKFDFHHYLIGFPQITTVKTWPSERFSVNHRPATASWASPPFAKVLTAYFTPVSANWSGNMRPYDGCVPVTRENEKPDQECFLYHRLCCGLIRSSFLTRPARLDCLLSKTRGRSPGCFALTGGIVSPLSAATEEEEKVHLKHPLLLLSELSTHPSAFKERVLCAGLGLCAPIWLQPTPRHFLPVELVVSKIHMNSAVFATWSSQNHFNERLLQLTECFQLLTSSQESF